MTTNLDHLKSAYAAWDQTKGGNRDIWAAMMAERFAISHVDENAPGLDFARDSVSRDEALAYLVRIFDEWEMVYYRPEHYVGEGDSIAMFGKCNFRHKGTGKEAEMRMACLWRFDGDKAVALTEIFDTAVAVKAATA